jgi:hypothetical protein
MEEKMNPEARNYSGQLEIWYPRQDPIVLSFSRDGDYAFGRAINSFGRFAVNKIRTNPDYKKSLQWAKEFKRIWNREEGLGVLLESLNGDTRNNILGIIVPNERSFGYTSENSNGSLGVHGQKFFNEGVRMLRDNELLGYKIEEFENNDELRESARYLNSSRLYMARKRIFSFLRAKP